MREDKKIFIHIGMPKAASTFMQKQIFENLEGYYFKYKNDNIFNLLFKKIFLDNGFDKKELRLVKEQIWEEIDEIQEKNIIISWEHFIGTPFLNYFNHIPLIKALKYIFPEAKLIFIIRRQDTFLESFYKQTVRHNCSTPINRFLSFEHFIPPYHSLYNIYVKSIDYNYFYSTLLKEFGEKNIVVLPYELLKYDNQKFCRKILEFLDYKKHLVIDNKIINKAINYYTVVVLRLFNRCILARRNTLGIIPSSHFFVNILKKSKHSFLKKSGYIWEKHFKLENILNFLFSNIHTKKKFIKLYERKKIMYIVSESNRKLDKRINLDLKKYGYY